MRFVCESCRAQYMINDDKVGPKGVKVRCRKCGYVITVKRPEAAAKAADLSAISDDAMATQVITPPNGEKGSSEGVKDNFLGADEDEIGAVFDQALRSGPTAAGQGGGDGKVSLSSDFDEHESTRVIDAATVAQLAKESSASEPVSERLEAVPETNWFVAINEKQTGPHTLDKVKEFWDQGEIGPDSLCWREGFQDWMPVSEVKPLAIVLAPKPPRPIVVPAATLPAAPAAVVSVPVQSAFSAGGVAQAVQQEIQVPMPAVPAAPDESGAWKPTAGSALASLVKDEMEALANPPPKPSPPPAADSEPVVAGRLIDVPDAKGASVPALAPLSPLAAPPPQANPYSANPAATYSAPAITAYRPPSNRGLVIGVGIAVGVVLIGLVATVAWLAGSRTSPPPPPIAAVTAPPAATATAPAVAPGPPAAAPTQPAAAPAQPAPPAVAPAVAGPGAPRGTEGSPAATAPAAAVAAAPRREPAPAEPPARTAVVRREAREPREPKEAPREVREPKPKAEAAEPSGSGDDFDRMFGRSGSKRDEPEPKKAEPAPRRETYLPPPPGGASDVKDTLESSDILEVVLANKPSLQKCAEEQRQKDPGNSGKLVVRWSVQSNGRVSNLVIVSEEFKTTYMAGCVSKAIKGWIFPRSKNPPEPYTLPLKF